MMFLASASEVLTNIAQAIQDWINSIPAWNWTSIWDWIKGIVTGSVGGVSLWAILKYAIPFLKDGKTKELLAKVVAQEENIKLLTSIVEESRSESKTIREVFTEYLSLQSETNATSRTLTLEQKQAFLDFAAKLRLIGTTETDIVANKVEETVEDGVVTAEEAIALAEATELGQKVLGTSIDSIIPKE